MLRLRCYEIVFDRFVVLCPLHSFYFEASGSVFFSDRCILITWFHYNEISGKTIFIFNVTCQSCNFS